jgi:hypothetical protein
MAIGTFREWLRECELNEAKIAKVELKDWERVIQLISTGKSPESQANAIKDKNKAMQRFIAYVKVEDIDPMKKLHGVAPYQSFICLGDEFGNRALELGATKEEIQDLFDKTELTIELKTKFAPLLVTSGRDNKIPAFTTALLKEGYTVKYIKSGNAITAVGKDAMSRNGRKWTIGRFVEITKDNKKFEFKFDEITDEGGGSSKYSLGYDELTLKEFIAKSLKIINDQF